MNGLEVIIPSIVPDQRTTGIALVEYGDMDVPVVEDSAERWRGGVKFTPFGRAARHSAGGGLSLCNDNVPRPAPGTIRTADTFDPFELSAAVESSIIDGFSQQELTEYLMTHAAVAMSAQIAAQTERNVFGVTSNDSLASAATTIASTDTSIAGALYAVESALADRLLNGAGMIHVPAAMLTMMVSEQLCHREDGHWVTPVGNVIVADAGYVGASPVTKGRIVGEVWIYASGPVVLRVGNWRMHEATSRFDRSRNILDVEVQTEAIVAFDADTVVTAKIVTSDGSVVA